MNRIVLLLICASLCLTGTSCKLFRKGQKEDPQVTLLKEIVSQTRAANVDYDNLLINGKARLSMPEGEFQNLSVSYKIYMEKDKAIMIRINKFIEVARVLIRPDSVFVLDKINKEYHLMSADGLSEFAGFPLDFQLVEDMMLGNFNPGGNLPTIKDISGNPAFLLSKFRSADLTYQINTEIHKMTALSIIDSAQNVEAQVNMNDFKEVGEYTLPNEVDIKVVSPSEAGAGFKHRKIDMNNEDFNIPFSVPASYKRVVH
ncbi:MAG: DUF4292 domain-containing protein [Bacteroidota bacterium]